MDWLTQFLSAFQGGGMGAPQAGPPPWLAQNTAMGLGPMGNGGAPPPAFPEPGPNPVTTYTPTPSPEATPIAAGGPSFFEPGGGLQSGLNALPGKFANLKAPPPRPVAMPTTPGAPPAARAVAGGIPPDVLMKLLFGQGSPGGVGAGATLGSALGTGRY